MAIQKRRDTNISISARAGTGKTTTLVQLVYRLMGHKSSKLLLQGSEQQEAIWKMATSGPPPASIKIVSFGTRSVEDIKSKLKIKDKRVTVSTVHGFGMSLLCQAQICKVNFGKWVNGDKDVFILADLLQHDSWRSVNNQYPGLIRLYKRMIGFIKSDLIPYLDHVDDPDFWLDTLEHYASFHSIEMKSEHVDMLCEIIPNVLQTSVDMAPRMIDFNDMIWLPHQLGLVDKAKPTVPLLLVDEGQDLNIGQRAILLAAASRIILVADEGQAVYGFQGADVMSVKNFEAELRKRPLGLTKLPLNESRRCPHSLVPFVKPLVSDFAVYKDNPVGSIYVSRYIDLAKHPHSYLGDKERVLIVARRNAYNVAMAIRFLSNSIACCILGKDFGDDLIDTITQIVNDDITISNIDALPLIAKWLNKEKKRLEATYPDSTLPVTLVEDKAECLSELCNRNQSTSVAMTIDFIRELFTDKDSTRVTFSSIHKAKGLEAPIIIFLNYNECPDPKVVPSSDMYQQERNLFYVAMTRTLGVLHFIESPPDAKTKRSRRCSLEDVQLVIDAKAERFEPQGVKVTTKVVDDTTPPWDDEPEEKPNDPHYPHYPQRGVFGKNKKAKVEDKKETKPLAKKARFTDEESIRANKSTERVKTKIGGPASVLSIEKSREAKIRELIELFQSLPPEDLEALLVELRGDINYDD